MKRILFTAVLLIALFVMVACGRSREEPEPTPTAIPAAEEPAAEESAEEESAEEEAAAEELAEEEVAAEELAEEEVAAEEEAAAEETAAEEPAEEEAAEADQGLGSMITVLLNDLFFGETNDNLTNPPTWTVSSGEEVSLTMQNLSVAVKHNWAVVKQGAEISVPYNAETDSESLLYESGLVDAESETELTFTAPDVGEYLVICTEPGHSVLMQGKLVVE